ncbi:MAG: hypothetical protein AB7S38_25340 [Vulcanimicrobiota bacterium]
MRVALLLFSLLLAGCGPSYKHPPGSLQLDEPKQTNLKDGPTWEIDDYKLVGLATFELEALVILRATFGSGSGREADLSPLDLTLAWGPAADSAFLRKINFRHSGRFYYYDWKDPGVDGSLLGSHTANMHMIPADASVADQLMAVERDDIVTLKGHLVRVDGEDGWHWQSSMTRKDSGAGSCELVRVTTIGIQ